MAAAAIAVGEMTAAAAAAALAASNRTNTNTNTNPTYVALVGVGLVGKAVLHQLTLVPSLRSQFHVVALATSQRILRLPIDDNDEATAAAATTVDALVTRLAEQPPEPNREAVPTLAVDHLLNVTAAARRTRGSAATVAPCTPALVVVDCTASATVPLHYPTWLAQGIHVVAANKQGFAGDLALVQRVRAHARSPTGQAKDPQAGLVFHESSVGAGLPVLTTLRDGIDTGDRIHRIEGVLSGSLSYVFNTFSPPSTPTTTPPSSSSAAAPRFSDIVVQAQERGYTEPDPRVDLSGMDVARKVVILARASGWPDLTVSDVTVTSLVPQALQTDATLALPWPQFLTLLRAHEEEEAKDKKKKEELNSGTTTTVLRYVGTVDLVKRTATVKLERLPTAHPFAALQGADNALRITTERFPQGIVIQGAGAGDAVTAQGVVADLLRVRHMHGFSPV